MAWDDAAKTMAVNVIAKVEGGGAWDAINYNDPITLGLMQWFGTRAADLLTRIKADHPTQYATILPSLRTDHANNPDNSRYWTSRYINRAEGNSIKPVLRAAKDTQGQLVASDVEDYKGVCDRVGLNVNTNTNTAIFFMCMYHQTPARALRILKSAGMGSSLDRIYAMCMNDPVFSRYKTRYKMARDIIKSGVPPTIIDLNDENDEGGDDSGIEAPGADNGDGEGTGNSVFDQVRTGIERIELMGDQLYIHLANGTLAYGVPTGGQNFVVAATFTGEVVPPATPEPDEEDTTPDPNPDPPTGNPATDTQKKIAKFMVDRTGRYGYSQGASRLTPERNLLTDCSGLTRFAYLSVTGKDIGTYTDAQVNSKETRLIQSGGGGTSPNESLMQVGDLVLTRRHGTPSNRIASHVEIYLGNGKIIGHGGVPYKGPVQKDLRINTANKQKWWIKRLKGL